MPPQHCSDIAHPPCCSPAAALAPLCRAPASAPPGRRHRAGAAASWPPVAQLQDLPAGLCCCCARIGTLAAAPGSDQRHDPLGPAPAPARPGRSRRTFTFEPDRVSAGGGFSSRLNAVPKNLCKVWSSAVASSTSSATIGSYRTPRPWSCC